MSFYVERRASRRQTLYDYLAQKTSPDALVGRTKPITRRRIVPETFSLSRNFDETVSFVADLRNGLDAIVQQQGYTDFRTAKFIGPAAGLLLAAEFDRRYKQRGTVPTLVKLRQWDPQVVTALKHMGFFDLLQPKGASKIREVDEPDTIYLKYLTGNRVLGAKAVELRDMLDKVCGVGGQSAKLYGALTEAMTNVLHHAYPENAEYSFVPLKGQWWMSASYAVKEKRLSVLFLDQGVGIPVTLPMKYNHNVLQQFLASLGMGNNDCDAIKAAIEIGQTQTGQRHRGKGLLKNVRSFIDAMPGGRLRILSRRGEYIYHSGGKEELRDRKSALGGTLLDWELQL